jgi:uncharacterized protein YbjT (DUF2867 family)
VDSAVGAFTATDGRVDGQALVLAGRQAIGFAEGAAAVGKAIGKEVKYVPVPHEAAKQAMVGMGFPEWIVDGYVELSVGFEDNFANTTTDGVEKLAGHAPRSFEQFAAEFAGVWRG